MDSAVAVQIVMHVYAAVGVMHIADSAVRPGANCAAVASGFLNVVPGRWIPEPILIATACIASRVHVAATGIATSIVHVTAASRAARVVQVTATSIATGVAAVV
jgi:hypothetical protein